MSQSDRVTREKAGKQAEGKTIRVSHENYARILKTKAKLLLGDTRPLKDRKDYSENDVITYLFESQKKEKRYEG